jgi:hypothetical protein
MLLKANTCKELLLGAAERHEEPVVEPLFRAFCRSRDRNVTALRQALGEEELPQSGQTGTRCS